MKFLMSVLKKAENKVTVALSAGVDSVAVAHFLHTRYPKINLRCFHYHHNLREQNNEMLEKANRFCDTHNIPLVCVKRAECGNESEAELRTARYKAMAGLGAVVTGHHLDDAVENYLYNCFNGVPEYLPIPLETHYKEFNLKILRPFIITEKTEMIQYIKENDLYKFVVEDETNVDENYRRNWLRNNLLPQIYNKGYNLKTVVRKRYNDYNKKSR